MNFASANKIFIKTALVLAVIYFLWIGVFGFAGFMTGMKSGNIMSDCPFDSQSACNMNLSQHIDAWQGMFAGLPQNDGSSGIAVLAFILIIGSVLFPNRYFSDIFKNNYCNWRFYIKKKISVFKDFNYFTEIFSGGILNPKTY